MKGKVKSYSLIIKPALEPKKRHRIEDKLKELGYRVTGGGTMADFSESDILFEEVVKNDF